ETLKMFLFQTCLLLFIINEKRIIHLEFNIESAIILFILKGEFFT
ncbi:MAG: hypothetical protein ACI9GZ_001075, partial [Bacteroidia bacterium]